MVDHSLVWSDFPSVSFFFARLCGLLESVGRKRPRVGSFVGRDCSYRSVLPFLFPSIHRLVGVAQTLIKFGEEVRSSQLETGLSSSKDRGALEVASLSTPHKAWGICCSLREKDKKVIRDRFQFSSSTKIRILDGDDRACLSYADEVCFYEANFVSGLHFPIHPFIRELFFFLQLAPAQLVPNLWRIVAYCMVIWMSTNDEDIISIDEFLHFYCLRKYKDPSY